MHAMPIPRRLLWYVGGLTVVGVLLCALVLATMPLPTRDVVQAVAVFSFLAALSYVFAYDLDSRTVGSTAMLAFHSMGALVPPAASVAGYAFVSGFGEVFSARDSIKRLFNFSNQLVGFILGLLAYQAAGGQMSTHALPAIVPFIVLTQVTKLNNIACFAGVMWFAERIPFRQTFVRKFTSTLSQDLIYIPLGYLFCLSYVRFGPLWSLLLLVPLLTVRQQFKNNATLVLIHQEMLQLMVAAIEARDPYTSGHSRRVARYSALIAGFAGRGDREVLRIERAALLHDVGKIHEEFAPILRKVGRLTEEERLVMQTHTEKGAALVRNASTLRPIVPSVRGHHERWDGNGYPDGFVGTAIPFGARVISLADTIDAMTTNRPYRDGMSASEVAAEIERGSASQFDPELAAIVLLPQNWYRIVTAIQEERMGAEAIAPSTGPRIPRHSQAS